MAEVQTNFQMLNHYRNLNKKRIEALESGNAIRYFELCEEIGVSPENRELYERGYADAIYEGLTENSDDSFSQLEEISRIALRRFPELEKGESIMDKEISRRLGEIRKAGYDVPAYSRLSKKEKWNLLINIRNDLGKKLKREDPRIYEEIREQNQRQKNDAYRFR